VLIPMKPLKRGRYKASVTVQIGAATLSKRWKFSAS
jgi:hypothetical protein